MKKKIKRAIISVSDKSNFANELESLLSKELETRKMFLENQRLKQILMTNKKPTLPKGLKDFKFKIYWIYDVIFIFFIGLQFIGTETTKPHNWKEFNNNLLQNQIVERVEIINDDVAEIYIKQEYLLKSYNETLNKNEER